MVLNTNTNQTKRSMQNEQVFKLEMIKRKTKQNRKAKRKSNRNTKHKTLYIFQYKTSPFY